MNANTPKPPPEIAALSFEAAMSELEAIVDELERGQVALEASIAKYERGKQLQAHCDALLKRAEMRVEKIQLGPGGAPSGTEPLDAA
jgi:exodeoxyribonuclease VII small subunit